MVNILKEVEFSQKVLRGRSYRLSIEDQLLMTLESIREDRTYFQVAASDQISESACYRIKQPDFALRGRKAL